MIIIYTTALVLLLLHPNVLHQTNDKGVSTGCAFTKLGILGKHKGGAPFIAKIADFAFAYYVVNLCGTHTSEHGIHCFESIAMEVVG